MHPNTSVGPSLRNLFDRVHSLSNRPSRDSQNLFWLEGIRPFIQAFDGHWHFEQVLYSPILLQNDAADMLARRLAARGIPRLRVTPEQFRALSPNRKDAGRASGIAAVVRQRWSPLESAGARAGPVPAMCWLVIEWIRSPGNLGSILRTAEACSVPGVIFLGPRADPFDPAAVRGSMGGLFHLRLIRTTHERFAHWAGTHRVQIVALSPDAPHPWTAPLTHGPRALAIGEERKGVSPQLRSLCHTALKLPMTGRADSLNVSVAAGIMMYEWLRQRTK